MRVTGFVAGLSMSTMDIGRLRQRRFRRLPLCLSKTGQEAQDQPTVSSSSSASPVSLWNQLEERFQGDFDNYPQVVDDRAKGLLPREGGGHEHIHCVLVPVDPVVMNQEKENFIETESKTSARLAAFYFDGLPQRIFRFRYYQLLMMMNNNIDDDDNMIDKKQIVDMQLYCLNTDLEQQLRRLQDPMEWPQAFQDFATANSNDAAKIVTLLPKCDIRWSLETDPIQHAYAIEHNNNKKQKQQQQQPSVTEDNGIHAVMTHGEAIVDSTMMAGVKIRIKDQLSLWQDQFWIHDRGLDPDTGAFIYGNQRNVPYQLQRVTNLVVESSDKEEMDDDVKNDNPQDPQSSPFQRSITKPALQWTLGSNWRTEDEYQAKLQAVGGEASAKMNKKPKDST